MKSPQFLILLISCQIIWAQNPNRIFESYTLKKDNSLEVTVNDGTYTIIPFSDQIVETTFEPQGQTSTSTSHAVVMTPKNFTTQLENNTETIRWDTGGIVVHITKSPFQISYFYKGNLLISEALGYDRNDSLETLQFNLKPKEILYGGGARALSMNRRGHRLELYNRAHYGYETHSELMNYTMPIVVSSDQYLVHFDNAPIGFLDLDSNNTNHLKYETISGRKTYQIITGDKWTDLINNYTDLTGKQPMPPRWALGNFSSRFGYHSQQEVENTIDKFLSYNIPVDAVILDLYWFGNSIKGTMGNLEVYRDSFPDFEGMVSRLSKKGVKTITITEPFILTTSDRWKEALDRDILAKNSQGDPYTYDFYFGHTGLIDLYSPKGKQWFWSIYKDLHQKGIRGVWGDLGEPEVHPSDLQHFTASADEVHNIYGHDWAGLIQKGYQKDFPEERPFTLMRAGYSGSQRYGLIPWSGDVNRTWGGLQSQPEIALQMGLQGLGFMHSDLGGFAGANLDDELYVRWLQYGVFQPIFRPHAQEEVPSEPVLRSPKAMALAKQAIKLRYSLLAYNYNMVFENHTQGLPLMRPLFFEDSSPRLKTISSTYLWGNDILVSPITKPNQLQQRVHFPNSFNWFDFYTDEKYTGGTQEEVKTSSDRIPTFVRGGAIIPLVEVVQSTDFYQLNSFQLHYYLDQSVPLSNREIYNDNGLLSEAYEKGQYEILKLTSKNNTNHIELNFGSELGPNYPSTIKTIEVIIHNLNAKPKRLKLNHKKVNFQYQPENKTLSTTVVWDTSKPSKLSIKL